MNGAILIRGGRILTMDPVLGELDGDVLIEDGAIVAVAAGLEAPHARIVDASASFVLPGFVDTHRHAWQSVVRFLGSSWDVNQYMARAHQVIAPAISPEEAFLGDRLSALSCLDAGITTVCDESHVQHSPAHTERVIEALRLSGIRARFGFGWSAGPHNLLGSDDPHPAHLEATRAGLLGDDAALVTMYAMLRGPVLSSSRRCLDDVARARALDLRMSFHVGHPNTEGRREISLLDDLKLLGPDMLFIHGGQSSDEELRMMADAGISLSIAAVVESRMAGIGRPVTSRALAAGVAPSFSADTELAAAGDMFGVMRAAYMADQLERMTLTEAGADAGALPELTPQALLQFATIGGARACGLGAVTGSLTPGKKADLILIDRDAPNLISPADSATRIVTGAHPGNVSTVFVDGVEHKSHGVLRQRAALDDLREPLHISGQRLLALVDENRRTS
ncbi:amidohydrolase family protein [Microbacterium sp. E-13]|uniref:amidohydrolase family protein n=1 Tax=Microbacterium sp. E-13 TaxID=3404048 RepID=UPI003CEBD7EF